MRVCVRVRVGSRDAYRSCQLLVKGGVSHHRSDRGRKTHSCPEQDDNDKKEYCSSQLDMAEDSKKELAQKLSNTQTAIVAKPSICAHCASRRFNHGARKSGSQLRLQSPPDSGAWPNLVPPKRPREGAHASSAALCLRRSRRHVCCDAANTFWCSLGVQLKTFMICVGDPRGFVFLIVIQVEVGVEVNDNTDHLVRGGRPEDCLAIRCRT